MHSGIERQFNSSDFRFSIYIFIFIFFNWNEIIPFHSIWSQLALAVSMWTGGIAAGIYEVDKYIIVERVDELKSILNGICFSSIKMGEYTLNLIKPLELKSNEWIEWINFNHNKIKIEEKKGRFLVVFFYHCIIVINSYELLWLLRCFQLNQPKGKKIHLYSMSQQTHETWFYWSLFIHRLIQINAYTYL